MTTASVPSSTDPYQDPDRQARIRPEWTRFCWETSGRSRVERALGLGHAMLWGELKHQAVDIVYTEGHEPFEVRHRFPRYDPRCDSLHDTLMFFRVRTETYLTHFAPLYQEYVSVRDLPEILFRFHQTGFLDLPGSHRKLLFLNPFREAQIQYAIDSRFLVIEEQGVPKLLRFSEDPAETRYSWLIDDINLDLDQKFLNFLRLILNATYTPAPYFFYVFEKYRNCTIVSETWARDPLRVTFEMSNGDQVALESRLYAAGKHLDHEHITINGVALSDVFVPLHPIPASCQEERDRPPTVRCVPDFYFTYANPYLHAECFPVHFIEHLPIQCFDPPYVILDKGVVNTPLGIYFS